MRSPLGPLRSTLFALLLTGVATLAVSVRWSHLDEPLWIDERHSEWVIAGSTSQIAARAAAGNQPPLYFYALSSVTAVAGESRLAIRSISLGASLAVLLLVSVGIAWRTRKISGALAAAVLLAIDPDLIFYALETRPYALVVLLAVVQAYCVAVRFRIAGLGQGSVPSLSERTGVVLLTVALVWLHFTTLILLAAEALWLLVHFRIDPFRRSDHRRGERWRWDRWRWDHRSRDVAIDLVIVGLLGLPLLSSLRRIATHRSDWSAFVTGDVEQAAPLMALGFWGLAVPALILGLERVVARWCVRRDSSEANQTPQAHAPRPFDTIGVALFFGGCALTAWVLAALATHLAGTPVLLDRYLIGTWGWVAVAAGMLVSTLNNAWLRPIIALSLAGIWCSGIETKSWYQTGRWPVHRIEPWAEVVQELNAASLSQQRVLLYAGLIEEERLLSNASRTELEYMRFPLLGLEQSERIEPCVSNPKLVWPESAGEWIDQAGGIAIVVRDHPESHHTVDAITAQLTATLQTLPGKFTIDVRGSGALFLITARRLKIENE